MPPEMTLGHAETVILLSLYFLQACGFVIFVLMCLQIVHESEPTQQHQQIVILVLILFMGAVSVANCFLTKG